MKDIKNHLAWMIKAATALNLTELRVFIVWFDDAPSFSAGASLLHQRLPHIARQNIQKAIRALIKKGFLVAAGKRNGRTHYNLGKLGESLEIRTGEGQESAEIQNESPQTQSESPEIQKSIPGDSRTKKTKKNKEDEDAHSSQNSSKEAKERVLESLAYDPSKDPDYDPEKPWMPTMAKLKSDYQIWFSGYPIDGDGYKNFEADVFAFIRKSRLIKFSDDGISYDEWPGPDFIMAEIEKKIAERFRENDRNPTWSFDGPISQKILSSLRGWVQKNTMTDIPQKVESPFVALPNDVDDDEFLAQLSGVSSSR